MVSSACRAYLLMVAALLLAAATAQAETRAELADRYVQILTEAPVPSQIEAVRALEWLGLSDPRVFDPVEKNLLARQGDDSKEGADYAGYLARALGYSGQEKYRATLTQVAAGAASKKLRRHAQNALHDLDAYLRWNPLIANTASDDAGKPVEVNALANMLRSDEPGLHRLAAKRIYQVRIRDPDLLGLLETQARSAATRPVAPGDELDTAAWLLKALAATGLPQYQPILATAAASGGHPKLRKYAEKYLRSYYP